MLSRVIVTLCSPAVAPIITPLIVTVSIATILSAVKLIPIF